MATKILPLESVGWDAAIQDAQKRIAKLRRAIAVCEEKRANGEPWPGNETAGTAVESIPAND